MRCAVAVAPLRAEPSDDAEQVTQALRGEPLRVEERRNGWARVLTAYDYPGWVHVDVLEEGEGELPAASGGAPVDVARSYLGTRYLWGGMTEHGIDCSGLVHMSYRRLGKLVPRDSGQQEEAGVEVSELRPGDLVTYGEPGGPRRPHCLLARGRTDPALDRARGRDRRRRGARAGVPSGAPAEARAALITLPAGELSRGTPSKGVDSS